MDDTPVLAGLDLLDPSNYDWAISPVPTATATATSNAAATGAINTVSGTTNQVNATTVSGAVTLGTPQDIATTSNVGFKDLGLNATAPTSGGQLKTLLGANGIDAIFITRAVDVAQTGNFIVFKSNAAVDLFKVTIDGVVTVGTWQATAIANAYLANSAVTVTAGTGLSGGGAVSLGAAVTVSLSTPVTVGRGGTGADLSATGGSHQVLIQTSTGGVISVARLAAADLSDTATTANVLRGNGTSFVSAALAAADLSNGVTGSGSVVLASSPSITTPTIASFTNAGHNHQSAAGGAALDTAAITSGTMATARLGSGSASSANFLRGDSSWALALPVGTYTAQATNFTATSNTAYWITADSVTATLPASPADGDYVILVDGAAVTAATTIVGRNGKTIMGLSANMTIDLTNFQVTLIYRSSTGDWRLAQ